MKLPSGAPSPKSDLRCVDCQCYHGMVVLKDVVWRSIAPDASVLLCICCIDLRLKRGRGYGLGLSDLKDVPANDVLFFAAMLGVRR